MASINMPSPNKKGPWDALAQALSVAKDIYGITSDMSQLDSAKAKDALDAKLKEQALKKGEMEMSPEYLSQQEERALNKARQEARIKGEEERKTVAFKAGIQPPKGYEKVIDPETGEEKIVSKKKSVPASEAVAVGGANAAIDALTDVEGLVSENAPAFGPIQGRLNSFAGWTGILPGADQSNSINASLKQRAQIIGKYLEGGKLAEGDIKRYVDQLPRLADTPEVANAKIQSLKRLIAQKQNRENTALEEAGYNTAGLKTSPVGDMPAIKDGANAGKSPGVIPDAQASGEMPMLKQVGDAIYVRKNGKWVRQ